MRIGIPKEVKVREGRVALIPPAVGDLVRNGHAIDRRCGERLSGRGLSSRGRADRLRGPRRQHRDHPAERITTIPLTCSMAWCSSA
jgi:hypothetical protein